MTKQEDGFIKKQFKLATSTAVITSVASFVLALWWMIIPFFMLLALISAAAPTSNTAYGVDDPIGYTKRIYGKDSDNEFLALPITGAIEGSKSSDNMSDLLFGSELYTYGYEVKKQLIQAANEEYKGVILEVDSPGGTIFGAKAISDGVDYYRKKTNNPVYVHVQGMAASGAYWASAPATKIYADVGTGIGSIGVIFGPIQFYDKPIAVDGGILGGGVVTQNGIEEKYITAGTGKDAGNPFRRLTDQEQKIMQDSVNDNYTRFVGHIASNRKIDANKIRTEIGAHLYGEEQAKKLGLIDQISDKETVYNDIARAAGINDNQFAIVSPDPMGQGFFGAFGAKAKSSIYKSSTTQKQNTGVNAQPRLCKENVTPLVYHGDLAAICSK
jgi:protease IV